MVGFTMKFWELKKVCWILNQGELFYIISGSDSDTVRRAYLQKSREHHPDKHPDYLDAEEKMAEISKANAILSHEGKKEVYDAYGSKVRNQINMRYCKDLF